jgi:DNA mismatch repair protein MutS2
VDSEPQEDRPVVDTDVAEGATAFARAHLDWATIETAFAERLATPTMRVRAEDPSAPVLPGTSDEAEVTRRLDELDGLEALIEVDEGRALGAALPRVEPIEPLLVRAARGSTLDLEELAAVGDVVAAASVVREALLPRAEKVASARVLRPLLSRLAPSAELEGSLARSVGRSDGEAVLLDTASPDLARLRRAVQGATRELRSAADRLIARSDLSAALSDRYWTEREGRVVLPVRSDGFARQGAPGKVAGIIHGASASGRTLFVEPHALIEPGNALRRAQMAVRAEERRVLAALSGAIGAAAPALSACLDALAQLDVVRARLLLSRRLGGLRPRVGRPGEGVSRLELPGVRHPSMLLQGADVVPNDLELAVGTALVVSGPNAGGKTVALKTMGLCVMMAQAGLRLPTSAEARVPLFRAVVTHVGDDQSIAASLSTFSAHVGHLAMALDRAEHDGAGTLVLLDEVAAGTEPEQGAALAEAVLDRLVELGASVVVTTHYERLALLASRAPDRYVNAAVGFDLAELRPTFQLTMGLPGSSNALPVARRLGLSEIVLERAEALLSDDRVRVDVLLREVEAEREALHRARRELEGEREENRQRAARLDAREAGKLQTATHRRAKAAEAAASRIRALEDEVRRRTAALRRATRADAERQPTQDARGFAREARARLADMRPPAPEPPGVPPQQLEVGAQVRVESFGAQGEVLAIKGDRVTVQLPGAKVTVARDTLRPATASPPRAQSVPRAAPAPSEAARHFGGDARPVREGIDNVVDVRGVRADEAVTMLEVFLDRAIADDCELVIVKHGHGSGALRKAVREHLPHLRHVARHRPGLPPEGGDAVTVVWVRG